MQGSSLISECWPSLSLETSFRSVHASSGCWPQSRSWFLGFCLCGLLSAPHTSALVTPFEHKFIMPVSSVKHSSVFQLLRLKAKLPTTLHWTRSPWKAWAVLRAASSLCAALVFVCPPPPRGHPSLLLLSQHPELFTLQGPLRQSLLGVLPPSLVETCFFLLCFT